MINWSAVIVYGSIVGCIYALAALGLVVVYKATRVLNFAQGAIGMFATFVFFYVQKARPHPPGAGFDPFYLVAVAIALASAAALGLGMALLLRPLRSAPVLNKVMMTLGVMTVLNAAAILIFSLDPVSPPSVFGNAVVRTPLDFTLSANQIGILGTTAALVILLTVFFRLTRLGVAMRAVSNDRASAALVGIDVERVVAASWVLGSMLAAVAGILISAQGTIDIFNATAIVILALGPALIGRLQSFLLTFAGGLLLGIIESVTRTEATVYGFALQKTVYPASFALILVALLWQGGTPWLEAGERV